MPGIKTNSAFKLLTQKVDPALTDSTSSCVRFSPAIVPSSANHKKTELPFNLRGMPRSTMDAQSAAYQPDYRLAAPAVEALTASQLSLAQTIAAIKNSLPFGTSAAGTNSATDGEL